PCPGNMRTFRDTNPAGPEDARTRIAAMVAVRVVLGGAVGLALSGLTARAQPPSPDDHTRELEVIESTERNEDPLGLDPSTGSGLDQAAAALPRAPALPPPAPVRGAAFSALGQVREESHAV